MTEDTQTQGRHFRLRGWHIVLALLVVLVGLIVLSFVVRRNRAEERIKALQAAGYPTTFAELAEYTKLPEGVQNAAQVYMRAFGAYVKPVDEVNTPVVGKAKWPDRGAALGPVMDKAITAYLTANQECLTLLHEAAGIEHCRYDPDYTQITSPLSEYRYCGQLLNVVAIYHASQGDAQAAAGCLKDGLRLSDSLQKQPALISYLVRIALVAIDLGGLERSLSLTTFTDAQLQELRETLLRTSSTLDLTRVMITERCFMIEACRNPSVLGSSVQGPPIHMFPGFRGTWLSDTLDFMGDYIEASRQPPRQRVARFQEIENQVHQLSFWHVMTKTLMPALTRVAQLDLRARAHLDLAQTALAVERYRLATGKLPQQLEDLVPQYLAQVPTDPFDGNPIRYRPGPPGYLLYSVGEDGRDNGGRERDDKDRDAPYDLCFIVTR
jgi:hypothetical protein